MWMYTPQDGDWWQDKPASILEGERHRLSVTMTEDPAEANALAERIVSFLNAPTVAAQQCGRDAAGLVMRLEAEVSIQRRLGEPIDGHLVEQAASLIQSQAARIAELEAGLDRQMSWVRAALDCKEWGWDGDQREAAEIEYAEARALLNRRAEG